MSMLDFLHRKYAGRSPLRIALHAGELAQGVLPAGDTRDLTFHIRHAVELGHAERIGHGVDLLSEDDSAALRAELHDANVLVEMCLTSNADILLVSGASHPLSAYMNSGVPLTIATDDPGVARSNMTLEYVRAATDQNLGYDALKTMARNSLEHSFLPGGSVFSSFADAAPAAACAGDVLGSDAPSASCKDFLAGSERATMQWDLERRSAVFEAAQR
jgi:adenosine deaminase